MANKKIEFPGDIQQEEATARMQNAGLLTDEQKLMQKQEDDLAKDVLIEREKENFTHILAQKCYNGWLKIYDNSAVIVSTYLSGKLDKQYERRDDKKYGKSKSEAKYGVVSIPPMRVGVFVQALARNNIAISRDDATMMEFELGERIGREDMIRMLHEDELIIEKVNKLVLPKAIVPELRAEAKTLMVYIHNLVRDQLKSTREIFLYGVEERAIDLNKIIIATARGRIEIDECLAEVAIGTERMYEDAKIMSDLGLISAKEYKNLVDAIIGLKNAQAREVKRRAIKNAEVKNTKDMKEKK